MRHAIRMLLAAICVFAAWWSVRMARADWLAASGSPEALSRAVSLEPRDARLRAIDAIARSDEGDTSPTVDRNLIAASDLNPLDSSVLMTLGLRAEFRGDLDAAEAWLVRAAEVDRQFKPAWTLANFYLRSNRPEKMTPLLRRCLQLDPLGFDTAPVFALFWATSSDPNQILSLIPRKRSRLVEYLAWLIRTQRVDAALQVWPQVLRVAETGPGGDNASLIPFPGLLVKASRTKEAVNAWNSLIDKGVIASAKLNPAAGASIADPSFNLPDSGGVFSWQLGAADGLYMRKLSPSLQIELDGNQPETVSLLLVTAPVVASHGYKLSWKVDPSGLNLKDDPGFRFHIAQGPGEPETICPLLTSGQPDCRFTAPGETVLVELIYSRAPGTIRAKGQLQILRTSLEFGS